MTVTYDIPNCTLEDTCVLRKLTGQNLVGLFDDGQTVTISVEDHLDSENLMICACDMLNLTPVARRAA